jgi:hypothetical protein
MKSQLANCPLIYPLKGKRYTSGRTVSPPIMGQSTFFYKTFIFKDSVTRFFAWVFTLIICPQTSEITLGFFENSWRYSQGKVHHRPAANFATGTAGVLNTGGK